MRREEEGEEEFQSSGAAAELSNYRLYLELFSIAIIFVPFAFGISIIDWFCKVIVDSC